MKRWIWILIIILILIIGGGAVYMLQSQQNNGISANPLSKSSGNSKSAQVSQFIQADFVDLDKIFSVSKFRSGSGHDFSSSGEKCRSMKHYFAPQYKPEGESLRVNGFPPGPDGKADIDIFSPVDGKITGIQSEKTPIGEQIYIEPTSNKNYTVRLFHIYKSAGIVKGTSVKAGQKIGVIGQYSTTDIAVMAGRNFISYFDVMPDSVFAKYQARGIKTRNELIISKSERDASPLECKGEQFTINYDSDPNSGNYAFLSGYSGETGSSSSSQPANTPSTLGTPTESTSEGMGSE